MSTPDDPASTLAEIRDRYAHGAKKTATGRDVCASVDDVPVLLAAIEAALKQADEWDAESDELDDRADSNRADDEAKPILRGEAIAYHDCADDLRATITKALTGELTAQAAEEPS